MCIRDISSLLERRWRLHTLVSPLQGQKLERTQMPLNRGMDKKYVNNFSNE
jgi:hypothetical protein